MLKAVQILSTTYPYADVVTGPGSCGDLMISYSHAYLLDFNQELIFAEFTLKPNINDTIHKLQLLRLQQKSAEQIHELQRCMYEFHLNDAIRRHNNAVSTVYPWQSRLNNIQYNVNSSFLDLQHSLPFNPTIFGKNAVCTFLKRSKKARRALLMNPKRDSPLLMRNNHFQTENLSPPSLLDLSALVLRREVSIEVFKAQPIASDFKDSMKTRTTFTNSGGDVVSVPLPSILCHFLENFVFREDQENFYHSFFRDHTLLEMVETRDRLNIIRSQPKYTIFYHRHALVRIEQIGNQRNKCQFLIDRFHNVAMEIVHFYEDLSLSQTTLEQRGRLYTDDVDGDGESYDSYNIFRMLDSDTEN